MINLHLTLSTTRLKILDETSICDLRPGHT